MQLPEVLHRGVALPALTLGTAAWLLLRDCDQSGSVAVLRGGVSGTPTSRNTGKTGLKDSCKDKCIKAWEVLGAVQVRVKGRAQTSCAVQCLK